jgi:Putative beta-barrel porin-2, OmpL-like. bbp2
MKPRNPRCGAAVRRALTWILLPLLAASAGAAEAPAEAPVSLQGIDAGGAGGLFSPAASRPLLVNGFGVADFSADRETGDSSFAAGALAVALFRSLSDNLNVFGQLTTAREPPSPFLGEEAGGSGTETEIDNLILTWRPSPGSGLDVTCGKFDSPLAIERDDAPLNFQATESFTLGFARPVKFTGLAVHEAFSSSFEGWAIVANGWDLETDNNHAKTGALYGLWSPSLGAHVGLGVIYGAERADGSGDARTTAVGTLLFQPAASWVWGGETVAGEEAGAAEEGGTAQWLAQTLFVHHRFGGHWAGTLRAEYFDDRDGARTGTPQTLRSLTLSPQYLVGGGFYGVFRYLDHTSLRLPGLAVRLDLRYDRSSVEAFATGEEEVGGRDHLSATLQTVFLF